MSAHAAVTVVLGLFSFPSECIHKPLRRPLRVVAYEDIRRGMKSRPTKEINGCAHTHIVSKLLLDYILPFFQWILFNWCKLFILHSLFPILYISLPNMVADISNHVMPAMTDIALCQKNHLNDVSMLHKISDFKLYSGVECDHELFNGM